MTIWDNIYKKYKTGGEAYATLSREIHPLFRTFLKRSKFKNKFALDIGCGTGGYMKALRTIGFNAEGIDSSKTAIKIAQENLKDKLHLICKDMFKFKIPKNRYGLIISVSTIHHGTKKQVEDLIDLIYDALIRGGKAFITLPDVHCIKSWNSFKKHKKIAKYTIVPLSGPEKGLPHSFYTKNEIKKLFSKFKDLRLRLDSEGAWVVIASR